MFICSKLKLVFKLKIVKFSAVATINNSSLIINLACSELFYKKILKIPKASSEDGQNGKIFNILANDMAKFDAAFKQFSNF